MIKERREEGYTLIEIMFVTMILVIITSSLYLIEKSISNVWSYNKLEANLEQELRLSMNIVVNNLQKAKFIKKVENNSAPRIIYINQIGEEKVIYYTGEGSLCLDDDNNIISNKINDFHLRVVNNLVYITLGIDDNGKEERLKTALKLRDEQLNI